MTYIYDIVLNLNENLYEFYEWDKDDKYFHIKKIGLFKIASKTFNDFLDYKVQFNESSKNILLNCEYYDSRNTKELERTILFTDSYRVVAISLNENLKIIKYSSLLLDEEEDILEFSSRLPIIDLSYNIEDANIISNMTRYEKKMLNYIEKKLKESYKKKELKQIRYLYFEYFKKENNDIENTYLSLLKTLKKFNERHYNLYKLIKLSL